MHSDKRRSAPQTAGESKLAEEEFHPSAVSRHRRFLPLVVLVAVCLYRSALLLTMYRMRVLHSNRYTYWSYALESAFYVALALANLAGPAGAPLRRLLSVYLFPVVAGTSSIVFAVIVTIVQLNGGWIMIEATVLGTGSVSVGTAHTADVVIHVLTVIDLFVVLLSGHAERIARDSARHLGDGAPEQGAPLGRWLALYAYYVLSVWVPALVYACVYDPFYEYPMGDVSAKLMLSAVFLAAAVIMSFFFWAVGARHAKVSASSAREQPI